MNNNSSDDREEEYRYIRSFLRKDPRKFLRLLSAFLSLPAGEKTVKIHQGKENRTTEVFSAVKRAEEWEAGIELRSFGQESNFYGPKLIQEPTAETSKRVYGSAPRLSENYFYGHVDTPSVRVQVKEASESSAESPVEEDLASSAGEESQVDKPVYMRPSVPNCRGWNPGEKKDQETIYSKERGKVTGATGYMADYIRFLATRALVNKEWDEQNKKKTG